MQTTIINKNISATIDHFGAELVKLEKDGQHLIWKPQAEFWDKTSPILFPFVGASKNDAYVFEGQTYPMSRHGFARNFEFALLQKSENSVIFSLMYSQETLKIFPFLFELQIHYRLENSCLKVTYQIVNHGKNPMFYSIGAHPAFQINGNFQDYSLVFNDADVLVSHQLHDNLFSGKTVEIPLKNGKLPLDYQLFENDALVLKDPNINSVSLLKNNQEILKVRFDDFQYLGIWTKKNAPFICIEPWLGLADSENASGNLIEKEGVMKIEANETQNFEWTVEVF